MTARVLVLSQSARLPDLGRTVMQDAVAAGEGRAVLAIAATDHAHHRNVAAQAVVQYGFVTRRQACVGQLQVA